MCAQPCQTLCDPMDLQTARLLRPWHSPGQGTGVGSHLLLRGSPQRRIKSTSPALAGEFLTTRATCGARPERAKALSEHTEDVFLSNVNLL